MREKKKEDNVNEREKRWIILIREWKEELSW